jgi:hypothetical protein
VKSLFLLFLFFLNPLYGLVDNSNCNNETASIKIENCIRVQTFDKKFKYYVVTEKMTIPIRSVNEFATTKLASYLKTKEGETVNALVHFHTYKLADGHSYFFNMEIFNIYK